MAGRDWRDDKPSSGVMSVAQMQANVDMSYRHIAKQERIIDRLTVHGHETVAEQAQAALAVMRTHLVIEIRMLDRMAHMVGARKKA